MSEFLGFEPAPHRTIWQALVDIADDPRLQRLAAEAHRMLAVVRTSPAAEGPQPGLDLDWQDFSSAIETEQEHRTPAKVLSANALSLPARFSAQFSSPKRTETPSSGNWILSATPAGSTGHFATFTAVRGRTQRSTVLEDEATWLQLFRNLVPVATADRLLASLKHGRAITFPGAYTSDQLAAFHFPGLR